MGEDLPPLLGIQGRKRGYIGEGGALLKRLLLLATMAAGWLFLRRRQQEMGASTGSTASTLSTGPASGQLSGMSGADTTSVTTDQDAAASGQLVDDVVVVGSTQDMSDTYVPSTDDASGGSPGHLHDEQLEMVTQAYDTSTQFEAVPAEPDRADAAGDSSSEGRLLPPDTQPMSVADTQGGEATNTGTGASVSEDAGAPTYLYSGTSGDESEQHGMEATSAAGARAPHPHHVDVSQGETVVFRPQHDGGDGSDHVTYGHDSGDAVSSESAGETGAASGVLMSSEEQPVSQSEYHSGDAADFDPIGVDVTPPKSDITAEDYKHVEVSLPPETLAAINELEQSGGWAETTDYHIEEGYNVEATDGGVGTVDRVVLGAGDTESYMLVKKGLLFKSDVSIPLSAVDRVENDTVYLNIEKQYIKLIEGDDTKEIGEDNLNIRY